VTVFGLALSLMVRSHKVGDHDNWRSIHPVSTGVQGVSGATIKYGQVKMNSFTNLDSLLSPT